MTAVALPLDQVAHEINTRLRLADKAEDHRIAAGRLLAEAQTRVQQGEVLREDGRPVGWEAWCAKNIHGRSPQDIRKVLALAKSDDPDAAREEEKQRNREAKRRERSDVSAVSPPDPVQSATDITPLIETVKALNLADFERFKAWFRGYCGV